jgi:23S rRNA pseudouridine2605 synthase
MARTDNFNKFVKKPKGSAIKEKIKQEKKKEKKERAAAIEAHFQRKREDKLRQQGIDPATVGDNRKAKFNKKGTANKYAPKATNTPSSANTPSYKSDKPGKPEKSSSKKQSFGEYRANKSNKKDLGQHRPAEHNNDIANDDRSFEAPAPAKTFTKHNEQKKPATNVAGAFGKKKSFEKPSSTRPHKKDSEQRTPAASNDRPASSRGKFTSEKASGSTPPKKKETEDTAPKAEVVNHSDHPTKFKNKPSHKSPTAQSDNRGKSANIQIVKSEAGTMPLNKYIAHSGVCARRDAAELVKQGKVTVNEQLIIDPGTKVSEYDVVKVSGKTITISKNFVYILLNKPKDYITTLEDPQGRKTVLELVRTATDERVYPVGRLDRNTSGVLLLTNDGDLAQKLSHPKHEVKKVYEVRLDRALTKGDMDKIANGITLEDGFVAPDVIAYADSKDKSIVGIEIHSGRNRIVRRIFEHMKYDVKALDRVMYAGLTKKDVLRGNWRFLKEKEVRLLKYMNQSYVKNKE